MHEGSIDPAGLARHPSQLGRCDGCARHSARGSDRCPVSRGAHFLRNAVRWCAMPKQRGLPVTAEATPHHFVLADTHMPPYDSNYKMKPPLRETSDRGGHRRHREGTVDAIATDHAPHPGDEKMQEFERCPFGILGLETALGLSLERLYHADKIKLPASCCAVHTEPGASFIARPRNAETGSTGRHHRVRVEPQLDLRCESLCFKEPQHSFPRLSIPRRTRRDGGCRTNCLASRVR